MSFIEVHLRADAPDKPLEGEPCNGCGVCCASGPCPLGMLFSGRRRGRCAALTWCETGGLYRCGLVQQPVDYLPRGTRWAAPILGRWARRWIAAGQACDSSCSVEPPARTDETVA